MLKFTFVRRGSLVRILCRFLARTPIQRVLPEESHSPIRFKVPHQVVAVVTDTVWTSELDRFIYK